jgi:hypothetical protein
MSEDLFGRRSLAGVVKATLDRLGGRAPVDKLVAGVRATMTIDEYEAWVVSAFRTAVKSAARRGAGTSEEATYIIGGEAVQEALFTVEDYVAVATIAARQGVANLNLVYRLAARCEERLGETFDADDLLATVRAA